MKDAKDKEGHSIKILGRAGMMFMDKKEKFFVDCEMLVGPHFDLVVYANSVSPWEGDSTMLTQARKDEIIRIVLKLLESTKIRAELAP